MAINIVFGIGGLAIGFALAYFYLKSKSESALSTAVERARLLENGTAELKNELRSTNEKASLSVAEERKRIEQLSNSLASAKTENESLKQKLTEQKAELAQLNQKFTKELKTWPTVS